jgi:hypothetical protein
MQEEVKPFGIQVQTINPDAYLTLALPRVPSRQ